MSIYNTVYLSSVYVMWWTMGKSGCLPNGGKNLMFAFQFLESVVFGASFQHTQIILLLTHLLQQLGYPGSYTDWDTGWTTGESCFGSQQRQEFLIFYKLPTPAGLLFKEAFINLTLYVPCIILQCVYKPTRCTNSCDQSLFFR